VEGEFMLRCFGNISLKSDFWWFLENDIFCILPYNKAVMFYAGESYVKSHIICYSRILLNIW
jgi:hypothetical protein